MSKLRLARRTNHLRNRDAKYLLLFSIIFSLVIIPTIGLGTTYNNQDLPSDIQSYIDHIDFDATDSSGQGAQIYFNGIPSRSGKVAEYIASFIVNSPSWKGSRSTSEVANEIHFHWWMAEKGLDRAGETRPNAINPIHLEYNRVDQSQLHQNLFKYAGPFFGFTADIAKSIPIKPQIIQGDPYENAMSTVPAILYSAPTSYHYPDQPVDPQSISAVDALLIGTPQSPFNLHETSTIRSASSNPVSKPDTGFGIPTNVGSNQDNGNTDSNYQGSNSIGERVAASEDLHVRSDPGTSSNVITTEAAGTMGTITSGPIFQDDYWWWQVSFDDGNAGWSADNWLALSSGPSNPVSDRDTGSFGTQTNVGPTYQGSNSIGERVVTTEGLHVRSDPGTSSNVITTEAAGAMGTITSGPIFQDDYWWWQVSFDDGNAGWSADNWLALSSGPSNPVSDPETGSFGTQTNVGPTYQGSNSIGERVVTTEGLHVRSDPGTSSNVITTEAAGAMGTITSGPIFQDDYWWWQVSFDDGNAGWSADNWLALSSGPSNPVSDPETGSFGTQTNLGPTYQGSNSIGERVVTTEGLHVRSDPGTSSNVITTEAAGAMGTITSGPIFQDDYWWWQVSFDDGNAGWSADNWLALSSGPSNPVSDPETGSFGTQTNVGPTYQGSNSIGERVVTTEGLHVRSDPGTSSNVITTEAAGAMGTITSGPIFQDDYWWWQVSFDDGNAGWSADNWLDSAQAYQEPAYQEPAYQEPAYQEPANAKFLIGNNVRVTTGLNVRTEPGTSGSKITTMTAGSTGTVLEGPVSAEGYTWWKISYDDGTTGWSADNWLESA